MKDYKTIQVNGKQVRLHRYLMEQKLGRKLSSNELVHHINGDKFDNRIENLEVVSRSEHKKKHPEIGINFQFKNKYNFNNEDIKNMYEFMTIYDIAKYFNVAHGTIYHRLKKMNVKFRKPGESPKVIKKEINENEN